MGYPLEKKQEAVQLEKKPGAQQKCKSGGPLAAMVVSGKRQGLLLFTDADCVVPSEMAEKWRGLIRKEFGHALLAIHHDFREVRFSIKMQGLDLGG